MNIRFGMATAHQSGAVLLVYAEIGYDVFKYISISRLLHAAPVKYAASYQYTESDGMDLTYFL